MAGQWTASFGCPLPGRLPGMGWRGPLVTERHSGTLTVEGMQDVHASSEPGWVALGGETVRSDALLQRVARPGADTPRLGGINALSGGRQADLCFAPITKRCKKQRINKNSGLYDLPLSGYQ